MNEVLKPSSEFVLDDIVVGALDPRGRRIIDIFWAVNEFKIFKTAKGISPCFSDDPDIAAQQKLNYVALGDGIASFNHVVGIHETPGPFGRAKQNAAKAFDVNPINVQAALERVYEPVNHFERELARCLAQALMGDPQTAKRSLNALLERIEAKLSNRARVNHIAVSFVLTAFVSIGVYLLILRTDISSYSSKFGFDLNDIGLAVMMGSIGALFFTAVRLRQMAVDPHVESKMHFIYGGLRILVGTIAAVILYFGFRSGILADVFQPFEFDPEKDADVRPHWLAFISILAGYSERLVPNLLNSRSKEFMERAKQGREFEAKAEDVAEQDVPISYGPPRRPRRAPRHSAGQSNMAAGKPISNAIAASNANSGVPKDT